jgi:hypothetical protein
LELLLTLIANFSDVNAGNMRAQIKSRRLIPYESIVTDVINPELLLGIIREGWHRDGELVARLQPPVQWQVANRSHAFNLHAWEPISQLLAGAQRFKQRAYVEIALAVVLDWLRIFQIPALEVKTYDQLDALVGQREDFVWYDMGVGLRCYRLAYIVDVAARDSKVTDADFLLLIRGLYFHLEAVARPGFFRGHNNHGIFQALGQLAASSRFAYLPDMPAHRMQAAGRVRRLLDNHVFRSGVHKEHSPGSHGLVLDALLGALKADLIADPETLEVAGRMEEAFAWMIMPNGALVPIGDTNGEPLYRNTKSSIPYSNAELIFLISKGRSGTGPAPGLKVYHDAGLIFARFPPPKAPGAEGPGGEADNPGEVPYSAWSYLAQTAAFHSRAHKHADNLSFVWHDLGSTILTDPGRYEYLGRTEPGSDLAKDGFWYADPKRIYVESTEAHNCIQIDGRNYPRVGVEPFGSAIVTATQQGGTVVTECLASYFGSIRHRRVLVWLPRQFLLVVDKVTDRAGRPHDVTQRFHFAPPWTLERADNGWTATHRDPAMRPIQVRSLLPGVTAQKPIQGQIEPRLLGWCVDGEAGFVSAPTVAYDAKGTASARFATLFVFAEEVAFVGSQLTGADGKLTDVFVWAAAGNSRKVTITHEMDETCSVRITGWNEQDPAAGPDKA